MAQRMINGEQYESLLIRGGIDGGPVPVVFASGITISGVTLGAEVEVANDIGSPIPVSDAGGSLTIDGTVRTLAGLSIPEHDNIQLTYTGENLTGVAYKVGATTVATLTLAYTGIRLDSVTKS